jgi:hypothetical protein
LLSAQQKKPAASRRRNFLSGHEDGAYAVHHGEPRSGEREAGMPNRSGPRDGGGKSS